MHGGERGPSFKDGQFVCRWVLENGKNCGAKFDTQHYLKLHKDELQHKKERARKTKKTEKKEKKEKKSKKKKKQSKKKTNSKKRRRATMRVVEVDCEDECEENAESGGEYENYQMEVVAPESDQTLRPLLAVGLRVEVLFENEGEELFYCGLIMLKSDRGDFFC
jgi:hypothetical protein